MEDYIFQIEVPVHEVTEIKGGKRQQSGEGTARLHPGADGSHRRVVGRGPQYPGRDGICRAVEQASPLSLHEVASLLAPVPEEKAAQKAETMRAAAVDFEVGQSVTVMDARSRRSRLP